MHEHNVQYILDPYNDLDELMTLTAQGKVTLHTAVYPLDAALDAIHDLDGGKLRGCPLFINSGYPLRFLDYQPVGVGVGTGPL